jgi:alanine or glycine:cation symporter, AGCS family
MRHTRKGLDVNLDPQAGGVFNPPPPIPHMASLEKLMSQFSGLVWGLPLIALLFGTHLFLTFRLGFIQRHIGRMIKLSVSRDKNAPGDVSQFGALATALAATIGTGNIYGVAGAVAIGGPGAVLWMWLTGIFGIATKYAEALLAVKYRVTMPDGEMAGGPMYVLERAMKAKWLGVLFAIFAAIAAFGIGNMVQSNTVADLAKENFGVAPWVTGVVLSSLTAAVILGGVKRIAIACEVLVPVMAVVYVLGCLVILIIRAPQIPETIGIIFEHAFTGTAAVGGFLGATIRQAIQAGIARGLFSNESGLGSAPIVAAAAQTKNPVRQAMVSATGTFWDTVVVCAMTGLVVVSSGHWKETLPAGSEKKALAIAAFQDVPYLGKFILTFGLLTFVFSTILGWAYYGEKSAEYLFGPKVVGPYRLLWVAAVFIGSTVTASIVWDFADAMNGLMAIPNLIALLTLSSVIVAETKAHAGEFSGRSD